VKVLLHSNLVEIRTSEDRSRIVEVEAATLSGKRFVVRPGQLVLAAGGIENARLLLLSEKEGAPALGNAHDQVGRHFTDHFSFYERLVPGEESWIDPLLRFERVPTPFGTEVICNFRLNPAIQQREGMSSILFRLFPNRPRSVIAARSPVAKLSGLQLDAEAARQAGVVARSIPELSRYAWRRVVNQEEPPAEFDLQVRVEPPPLPENRLTLTDERDALGQRRLRLDWRIDELSRHTARRGIELFAAEAARVGLGRVESRFSATGEFPHSFEVGYHHCGSTRMSADPRSGVVDPDGRVWGTENLYVAGSGVFVTAGSGSPTMMIAAMTLRLASHLKEKLTA
jgi:choline dehydrogenase-like flavoprotein